MGKNAQEKASGTVYRDVIEFHDLLLHEGLNFTLRYGDKWHKALTPGDKVLLKCSKKGIAAMPAEVVQISCAKLLNLPHIVFEREHDPSWRSPWDAAEGAKDIYKELENKEVIDICYETFTAIGFKVIKFGE